MTPGELTHAASSLFVHVAFLMMILCLTSATFSWRLFYFFEFRRHKEDPVVIWLTGGPGYCSELALFYENGPFHIADNMSLLWNEFGWDQVYYIYRQFVY